MEDLGYEVDLAVADANSRIWEMMNPPEMEEPEPDEEPEYNLYRAEDELERGISGLYEAIKHVENAADEAEGHPVAARIRAALNTLVNTDIWVKQLKAMITKELIEEENRRHAG